MHYNVRIQHNPFTEKVAVFVNEKRLEISSLSRYSGKPFVAWVDKIFESIFNELNREYECVYVGFKFFWKIVEHCFKKQFANKNMQFEEPLINRSIASRINELKMISTNSFELKKYAESVVIYTDVNHLIDSALRKLSANPLINLCVRPLNEYYCNSELKTFIVSAKKIEENIIKPNVFFSINNKNQFEGLCGETVYEKSEIVEISDLLISYVEHFVLPTIINEIVVNEFGNSEYAHEKLLNSILPQICYKIPKSIECGECRPIQCEILPNNIAEIVKFQFISSDERIVEVVNNTIIAKETGEAAIIVRYNDEIITEQIRVYKRIRANKITLSHQLVNFAIGESISLNIFCEPKNADNISKAVFETSANHISAIKLSHDEIRVAAISEGNSKLRIKIDELSAECSFNVHKPLCDINILIKKNQLKRDEYTIVEFSPVPQDALIEHFDICFTPNTIAKYECIGNRVTALHEGKGVLTIHEKRSGISKSIDFTVI